MSATHLTRRQALALSLAGVALAGLGGCVMADAPPFLEPKGRRWQAPHGLDHPLVGQCIEPGVSGNLGAPEIPRRLAEARYILLGETHDNPDHHVLQAEAIRAVVAAGRRPAVLLEMISDEQGPALARHLRDSPHDAAGLGPAIGWEKSGWPDWVIYRPIAEAALELGLTILPANLDRAVVRGLGKASGQGTDHAELKTRLKLDEPLPPLLDRSLRREIVEAHCGQIDEASAEPMVLGQRARDAYMAQQLLNAGGADGAILIAGAGHARTDRGVPYHLKGFAPDAVSISLAFIEVSDDRQSAGDYAPAKDEPQLPYDLVYFTPRIDVRDPCERFKEQLEKIKPTQPPTKA